MLADPAQSQGGFLWEVAFSRLHSLPFHAELSQPEDAQAPGCQSPALP